MNEPTNEKDWGMIEDILHSPRSRLSQNIEDETGETREGNVQRAVLRRIDNEDSTRAATPYEKTTTVDSSLPVLEHVVTSSFARTVDHSVFDDEFEKIFLEDAIEEQGKFHSLSLFFH